MNNTEKYKRKHGWTKSKKIKADCKGGQFENYLAWQFSKFIYVICNFTDNSWKTFVCCEAMYKCSLLLLRSIAPRGGGVLPYKRLMGMCRWMGWFFFSRLDWLQWGRIFNKVTRMGWHIFEFFGVRQFFIFTVSTDVPGCLYCRWKLKCSSFNVKKCVNS